MSKKVSDINFVESLIEHQKKRAGKTRKIIIIDRHHQRLFTILYTSCKDIWSIEYSVSLKGFNISHVCSQYSHIWTNIYTDEDLEKGEHVGSVEPLSSCPIKSNAPHFPNFMKVYDDTVNGERKLGILVACLKFCTYLLSYCYEMAIIFHKA